MSFWRHIFILTSCCLLKQATAFEVRLPIAVKDPDNPTNQAIAQMFGNQAALGEGNGRIVKAADWLFGVSKVNGNLNYLRQHYLDLQLEHGAEPIAYQLHFYQDKSTGANNNWAGYDLDEQDQVPDGIRSLAVLGNEIPGQTNYTLGMILQEWTEIIPDDEQVAGLALNYNQPDSEAPNALLLTVQPNLTTNWHQESLLGFVEEAFRLSKLRLVDTDLIKKDLGLATYLPAIANDYLPGSLNRDPSNPRELDYTWVNKPRS